MQALGPLLIALTALPALGIAGLGARDIMGYCVIALLVCGVIISLGLLFLPGLFGALTAVVAAAPVL